MKMSLTYNLSDEQIETICRAAHEINRHYCEAGGESTSGDWDHCPEWQRDSTRDGVRFRLAHPNLPDSEQHNAWMRDKIADGWRYGPLKNSSDKTHPCLVSFDELPIYDQVKDRLFAATVVGLAGRMVKKDAEL